MVDLLQVARTGVSCEQAQIGAVGLDGVLRGVNLAQVSDEIGHDLRDDVIRVAKRPHAYFVFARG